MALSDSAGVGSALPSQVGVTSGYALTTDGTIASWTNVAAAGGVTTMTAVGSSPSANGASISGVNLTLQPADGTHPGVLTSGTQTIGGAKTFSSALVTTGASVKTGDGVTTSQALLGDLSGSGGLWFASGAGTPSSSNYTIFDFSNETYLNTRSAGNLYFAINGTAVAHIAATTFDMTGLGNGGSIKLKSPNGTTFTATISNAGAWVIA